MEEGIPVVGVVIGADDNQRRTDNTIGTLKSLESISARTLRPAVISYHENYNGARSAVDDNVLFCIDVLAQLGSQTNDELDAQDVTNWVYYNQATAVGHQLSSLTIHLTRQEANSVVEPISVASLYDDPDKDGGFGNPAYSTSGFTDQLQVGDQVHFVINHKDVEHIFTHLQDRKAELAKLHGSYTQRKAIVDRDDDVTDDGLVF